MILRAEAELPLKRVTFPPRLDHSWSFTTSAMHARPFKLRSEGTADPQAAHLHEVDSGVFMLGVAESASWTDDRPVTPMELARCLRRGLALTAAPDIRILEESNAGIRIAAGQRARTVAKFLATSAFSLTPCIRDTPERHTSGPFAIAAIDDGGRTVRLRRRASGAAERDINEIALVATGSVSEGMDLFKKGALDLTRVLGGCLDTRYEGPNSTVDLVMGLRGSPGSAIAGTIAANVNCDKLAAVTGGTYLTAAGHITNLGRKPRKPGVFTQKRLVVQYTDFHPNRNVAEALLEQLEPIGVDCQLRAVSYEDYLRGEVPAFGVQLEIIDPVYGTGSGFAALLQARSTLVCGDRIRVKGSVVNSRAEIDWDQIQWGAAC